MIKFLQVNENLAINVNEIISIELAEDTKYHTIYARQKLKRNDEIPHIVAQFKLDEKQHAEIFFNSLLNKLDVIRNVPLKVIK